MKLKIDRFHSLKESLVSLEDLDQKERKKKQLEQVRENKLKQ